MKLDELLGVKHLYDKHLNDVLKVFTTGSTYKKLGQGATATAFAQGDEYVYKFWLKDTSYEKYVNYCLDNQDNPHIPVLYSDIKKLHSFFTRVEDFPDKIRYIKMERLKPITNTTIWPGVSAKRVVGQNTNYDIHYDIHIASIIDNLYYMIYNNNKMMLNDTIQKITEENFKEKIIEYYRSNGDIKITSAALDEIFEVYKIMYDLRHSVFKDDSGADYHAGNIMMRGETIVITDPYADQESMELSDDIARAMKNLSQILKAKKNPKNKFVDNIKFKSGISKK